MYELSDRLRLMSDVFTALKRPLRSDVPSERTSFINFVETPETITYEIVSLMNELNLDVKNEDINESIESHSAPLSNEYLIEQQLNNNKIHNECEEEETDKNIKTMTIKNMNEAFMHLEKLLTVMEEYDPNGECISQVRRAIQKDTACYRNLYQEKKNGWYSTNS